LDDDLNTPAAFGALFTIRNEMLLSKRDLTSADAESFERAVFALGLKLDPAPSHPQNVPDAPIEITALAEKRWAAKKA
jgi:cysteinyl-tRNA synthetase